MVRGTVSLWSYDRCWSQPNHHARNSQSHQQILCLPGTFTTVRKQRHSPGDWSSNHNGFRPFQFAYTETFLGLSCRALYSDFKPMTIGLLLLVAFSNSLDVVHPLL